MKVLFVASEMAPYCKSGGLGDVIGALPPALAQLGTETRVIIPCYADISEKYSSEFEYVMDFNVAVGWRNQNCTLLQHSMNGIVTYLVKNDQYFGRIGLYGYYDDGERFAFFMQAAVQAILKLDYQPDVIHCHDWQAALVPFYLKRICGRDIASVFTIHNIKYQGRYGRDIVQELLSVDNAWFDNGKLEFNGDVNMMKTAIEEADAVTTVSGTYAEELCTPYYGEGLDGVLAGRGDALIGIENGIDIESYDPSADSTLERKYSVKSVTYGKKVNKQALQRLMGLPEEPDVPLIAMVTRLDEHKGMDLVVQTFAELVRMGVQVAILGTGSPELEDAVRRGAQLYPRRIAASISFNLNMARKLYAGADMFLMPSRFEPCGLSQMIAQRYGTLPIVRETGGLKDTVIPYNMYTGEGDGFSFANYTQYEMLDTVRRACEAYKDKKVWSQLIKNAMTKDVSWKKSADRYVELYERILAGRN